MSSGARGRGFDVRGSASRRGRGGVADLPHARLRGGRDRGADVAEASETGSAGWSVCLSRPAGGGVLSDAHARGVAAAVVRSAAIIVVKPARAKSGGARAGFVANSAAGAGSVRGGGCACGFGGAGGGGGARWVSGRRGRRAAWAAGMPGWRGYVRLKWPRARAIARVILLVPGRLGVGPVVEAAAAGGVRGVASEMGQEWGTADVA